MRRKGAGGADDHAQVVDRLGSLAYLVERLMDHIPTLHPQIREWAERELATTRALLERVRERRGGAVGARWWGDE